MVGWRGREGMGHITANQIIFRDLDCHRLWDIQEGNSVSDLSLWYEKKLLTLLEMQNQYFLSKWVYGVNLLGVSGESCWHMESLFCCYRNNFSLELTVTNGLGISPLRWFYSVPILNVQQFQETSGSALRCLLWPSSEGFVLASRSAFMATF